MQINLGSVVNDGTGNPLRTGGLVINQYGILNDKTINAAFYKTASNTNEAAITLAIVAAALLGTGAAVWVPQSMLPYNASLVTFNTAVRVIREGGNPLWYDMLAYGYQLGDSSIGATPALNAAHAAAVVGQGGTGGGCVYFPPGQYWFMSSPTTISGLDVNVTWLGAGHNATLLVQGAAGVTIIPIGTNTSRFFARRMWIGSFSNFATGGGLNATAAGYPNTPASDMIFEDLVFQNLPNPIYLDNVSQTTFRDIKVTQTRAGATIGHCCYMIRSVTNVFDNWIINCPTGTLPGDAFRIDSDCDTILCWKCEAVLLGNGAGTTGFHIMDSVGSGTNPARIVRLTDCLAENGQVGFQVDAARDVRMTNCEVANHNQHGFLITAGNSVAVMNSLSFLNKRHGIWAQGGSGLVIEGNTCSNNSQETNATYDGIVVSSATGTRVVGNRSGDFLFTGLTNKQRVGLNLVAGSDYLYVGGNDLQGNTGQGFQQAVLQGSTGQNNQFFGTRYLPVAEATLVAGVDTEALAQATITVTLTAARVVGNLLSKFIGQRATFTFTQNGTGGWAVTWNAAYKVTWSDTGNTLNKRSSISFVWDGTNWNQDGAQTPYV